MPIQRKNLFLTWGIRINSCLSFWYFLHWA